MKNRWFKLRKCGGCRKRDDLIDRLIKEVVALNRLVREGQNLRFKNLKPASRARIK